MLQAEKPEQVLPTAVASLEKPKQEGKPAQAISTNNWWTYTLLTLGLIIMIVPFVWMILSSLKGPAELAHLPPTWLPTAPNWAIFLAESLGRDLVQLDLQGDGAGSLVDGWASRKPDGSIDILVWNGTLDQSKVKGDPLLDRHIEVRIEQLSERTYQCFLARVDAVYSNIAAHWTSENGWPTPEQWDELHTFDRLDEHPLPDVVPQNGTAHFDFDLPMPGVVRLRLTPK